MGSMSGSTALTMDQLRLTAPSVFSGHPKDGLSSKYEFVPTIDVVDMLAEKNWFPVKAQEVPAKDASFRQYQKHMLRFRNFNEEQQSNMVVGDTFIEMVLTNSHNGRASFIFNLGLWRLACSNGMVVSESTFAQVTIRHCCFQARQAAQICGDIVQSAPNLMEEINILRQIELKRMDQFVFAQMASLIRFGNKTIDSDLILAPRREADSGTDLWTVYNVVQENLTKGNLPYIKIDKSGNTNHMHTTEIKAIDSSIKLNKRLWTLVQDTKSKLLSA